MDFTAELFNLLDKANGYTEMNEIQKKEVLLKIDQQWDDLPEAKLECNEKSKLALFMTNSALGLSMLDMADKWTDILLMDRLDNPIEVGMYKGEMAFTRKNYVEAFIHFKMAYDAGGQHVFKGSDPAYFDLYKNPEKYM
ncbi:hypothetical protein [Pedobacter sp. Hv1]|uniref:hypothetical protein n=1 Tax=Pedobacter sp. Hv1 TaxID=1740090 RepID=UPI0006D89BD4|nr:hypothetical protein [Pedobacter sp. Hv1]KQC02798.1 hypothetical protein AQF98_04280 [Pedobacter sp. Hv1]